MRISDWSSDVCSSDLSSPRPALVKSITIWLFSVSAAACADDITSVIAHKPNKNLRIYPPVECEAIQQITMSSATKNRYASAFFSNSLTTFGFAFHPYPSLPDLRKTRIELHCRRDIAQL